MDLKRQCPWCGQNIHAVLEMDWGQKYLTHLSVECSAEFPGEEP